MSDNIADQFYGVVDDEKLRMSLVAMADKLDQRARLIVYQTYNDPEIASLYRMERNAGEIFRENGRVKTQRPILKFPNKYVYQFLEKTMTALYGPHWLDDDKALKHELVRPWWVVSKL